MSLDPEPWAPPKSELSPGTPPGVGLTRAVVDGLAALLSFWIPCLILFWFLLPRGVSTAEGVRYFRSLPYSDAAALAMRLGGVLVAGAVAARRYRGRWLVGSAAVGVIPLMIWLLPIVLMKPDIGPLDWQSILLAMPAAIAGGVLGALTKPSTRRRR